MKNNEIKRISNILDDYKDFLKANYNVKKIGFFGSVARGEHKTRSDIDIMVEFSEPISFFEFIRLEQFLSKILKKKVDLVTKSAIKPVVKKQILKDLIYV